MPLPLGTGENEFYWTAGADGVLRSKRRTACDSLIHPRGHIVGVTVNHQQWGPEPPEPYALAAVAGDPQPLPPLEDDPDEVRRKTRRPASATASPRPNSTRSCRLPSPRDRVGGFSHGGTARSESDRA